MKKVNMMRRIVLLWIVLWSVNFLNLQLVIMLIGPVLAILFIGARCKLNRKLFIYAVYVLLFSFVYAIMNFDKKGIGFLILYFVTPVSAFIIGYYFVKMGGKSTAEAVYLLYDTLCVSMFLYATLNMSYLLMHGWSYDKRGTFDFWTGNGVNPTNQGGYLTLVSVYAPLLLLCRKRLGKKRTFAYFLILVMSIIYTLLLGNRTLLVLILFSTVAGYCAYIGNINNKATFFFKTIVIICVAFGIIGMIYFLDIAKIQTFWKSTTFYTRMQYMGTKYDRTIAENDRFPTWILTIKTIPSHIFGGIPDGAIISYAHNMWLDVQWTGGIFPLIALILITIFFVITVISAKSNWKHDKQMLIFIISFSVTILLEFMVEPIIEGYYYLFLTFFILYGAILASNHGCIYMKSRSDH